MEPIVKRDLYSKIASLIGAINRCREGGNVEWMENHTETIHALCRDHLPYGAGFDGGTTIDIDNSTSERLVFNTSFHPMDENGCYDGWTSHVVTITPSLQFFFNVRVDGENRDGINDYIEECFSV